MSGVDSMSSAQLRALAAKREREERPDVVDVARAAESGRPPIAALEAAPEVTVGERTFAVQPGLADNWEYLLAVSALQDGHETAENFERIFGWMFGDQVDAVKGALRDLHPGEPWMHTADVTQLVQDVAPKG